MPSDILYERVMGHGPSIQIRVTSASGESPITAVLEVDRRAGTPRAGLGTLPGLARCEAPSEADALAVLEPKASDDRTIAMLMRERGLR
ncbi:MAG: hypothetical protein ACHQWU_09720 [Gemmatimonadales bacterium]|jgi:hypothetical protein